MTSSPCPQLNSENIYSTILRSRVIYLCVVAKVKRKKREENSDWLLSVEVTLQFFPTPHRAAAWHATTTACFFTGQGAVGGGLHFSSGCIHSSKLLTFQCIWGGLQFWELKSRVYLSLHIP